MPCGDTPGVNDLMLVGGYGYYLAVPVGVVRGAMGGRLLASVKLTKVETAESRENAIPII